MTLVSSQPAIFSLGATDHLYLEFDLPSSDGARATPDAVRAGLAAAVAVVDDLGGGPH
jgi:hypothetical protein